MIEKKEIGEFEIVEGTICAAQSVLSYILTRCYSQENEETAKKVVEINNLLFEARRLLREAKEEVGVPM